MIPAERARVRGHARGSRLRERRAALAHPRAVAARGELALHARMHDEERELVKIVPRGLWKVVNALFVSFGKEVCRPIGPKCGTCLVNKYCDYFSTVFKKKKK
jgi:endonuclease-3